MTLNDGKYCSIVCANRYMQSNSFHKSFGRPSYFFRLNFTSAVNDMPVAYVHWIHMDSVKDHHTYVVGNMTTTAWETQPNTSNNTNPFIMLDDIFPGRYAVAFEKLQRRIRVGFICLDPSKAVVDTGEYHDFGDDVFPFFKKTYYKKHTNSSSDNNDSLLHQHIPLSVLQFMKQFKQQQHTDDDAR